MTPESASPGLPFRGHVFFWASAVKHQPPDIIEHTIAFWRKRTGEECSHEDARQMVANITGFFDVLAEWDRYSQEESQQCKES